MVEDRGDDYVANNGRLMRFAKDLLSYASGG